MEAGSGEDECWAEEAGCPRRAGLRGGERVWIPILEDRERLEAQGWWVAPGQVGPGIQES